MVLLVGCSSQLPGGAWDEPQLLSAASVDAWSYANNSGWKICTPHYTIYTTIIDASMRVRLPQIMEGGFSKYCELAQGVKVSQAPMECFIFNERSQWHRFTADNTGRDAGIYLQIRRGGYAVRDRYVSYFIGLHNTASVSAHEGFHQFVYRNFKGRLPPFLEEGLATTFEGVNVDGTLPRWNTKYNPLRASELRRSIDDKKLWPTEELIRMHAGQVVEKTGDRIEAFYSQCWCFAKFLREAEGGRYAPALQALLTDTANGTVYDPTHSHQRNGLPWNGAGVKPMLEHYLGMSMADIDKAFQTYEVYVAYHEFPENFENVSW